MLREFFLSSGWGGGREVAYLLKQRGLSAGTCTTQTTHEENTLSLVVRHGSNFCEGTIIK
jgi:hypothetical protein